MSLTSDASTAIFFLTLGYAALCAISPYGPCRSCNGFGFHLTTTLSGRPKRGRDCRRCKGHGIRLRLGRRIFNFFAALRRNGNR